MKTNDDISREVADELRGISSTLASIPKKNIFSVPEKFFEELEKATLAIISAEENLSEREDLPEIPAGYFDSLPDKILERIHKRNVEMKPGILRMFTRKQYWLAAASVVMLASLGIFLREKLSLSTETISAATMPSHLSAESYLADNIYDVDEASIVQVLLEEEFPAQDENNSEGNEEDMSDYENLILELGDIDQSTIEQL